MKRLFPLMLMLTATITFAQEKSNYNGNYTINKSKIEFGELPEYVLPISFKVAQNGNQLTITRNTISDKGDQRSFTETIILGGDSVNSTIPGGLHRVAIAAWNSDQKTFVVKSDSRNADHTAGIQLTEIWSLLDDGKTLEVDRVVLQADGKAYTIKGYYDRAN